MPQTSEDVRQRVDALVGEWNVRVQDTSETESSILVFGTWRSQPVVLKVVKHHGDEWHSGEVLQAFGGNGVVGVYECAEGAVLLERAVPGGSLVSMATDGRDGEATMILADVIQRMPDVRRRDNARLFTIGQRDSIATLPDST